MNIESVVRNNKSAVTRFANEVASHGTTPLTEIRLNSLVSKLNGKLEIFMKALEQACSDPSVDESDVDKLNEQIEICQDLLATVDSYKNITTPASKISVTKSCAKLPKLTIEPFYGEITKFSQFWSLFESCIDNNTSLTDTAKLSYLLSYLRGEASQLVCGITVDPKNYIIVKDLLFERYGNSRKLINLLFDKIIKMQPCNDTLNDLLRFYNELIGHVRSLENMGILIDTHSVLLCPRILEKLPENIRIRVAERFTTDDWKMSELLQSIAAYKKLMESCNFELENDPGNTIESLYVKGSKTNSNSTYEKFCVFCNERGHGSVYCKKYVDYDARICALRINRLCLKCLKTGHFAKDCKTNLLCNECKGKHHKALCRNICGSSILKGTNSTSSFPNNHALQNKSNNLVNTQNNETSDKTEEVSSNLVDHNIKSTLYQSFSVECCENNAQVSMFVNVLLDTGSQVTFISRDTANYLKLPIIGSKRLKINTFMNSNGVEDEYDLVDCSLKLDNQFMKIQAIVVPSIASNAGCSVSYNSFPSHLKWAPRIISSRPIDILIGMDYYYKIVIGSIERFSTGFVALETLFGWILSGDSSTCPNITNTMIVSSNQYDLKIENQIDAIFNHDFSLLEGSESDNELANFLENVYYNNHEQRYYLKLPWKKDVKLVNHKFLSVPGQNTPYRKLLLLIVYYLIALIVRHHLEKLFPSRVPLTLANIRNLFLIPKGRQVIKMIMFHCFVCRKVNGGPFPYRIPPPLADFHELVIVLNLLS